MLLIVGKNDRIPASIADSSVPAVADIAPSPSLRLSILPAAERSAIVCLVGHAPAVGTDSFPCVVDLDLKLQSHLQRCQLYLLELQFQSISNLLFRSLQRILSSSIDALLRSFALTACVA